jgi:nucleoside-diphosphate-sugar epimerase
MGRRVLVTGASGCIGRALVPLLEQEGWDVHTSSPSADEQRPGLPHHAANLLQPGEARRVVRAVNPDALMHLAWFMTPGRWAAAVENVDWVRASLELVQEFAAAGGRRVVVSGSCLEYDWDYGYCSEARTPCQPHTLYGTAKNALRLVLEGLAAQAQFTLAWGRVFLVYGPHEHPDRLVPAVIRALLKGEPARVSHGRQVRDYLYTEDVARAFAALLSSDVEGPINVASGQPVAIRTIAERIGDLLGRRELLRVGAIPAAATDKPLVVGDVSRIQSALGWAPEVSLDEGLQLSIDWWRRAPGGAAAR